MLIQINDKTLELAEGDITELHTDAIINVANSSLISGAGVEGTIQAKGGTAIQQITDNVMTATCRPAWVCGDPDGLLTGRVIEWIKAH